MRRLRAEKAIQLAMQNKWQEAADLNRQILEQFPDDVDTLNRLGKALMELGQYADARDQYAKSTKIDPSNGIAAKNLVRLTKLAEDVASAPVVAVSHSRTVDPSLFIEESGKTAVTDLVDVAPFQRIATLTAGDKLSVVVDSGVVRLIAEGDVLVGQLEPKIAQRVLRLVTAGNRYGATITSIDEHHVRIIIREEFRHPSMRSRPSFPTQAALVRPDTRDSVFRPDMDDEDDDSMDDGDVDTETVDVADGDGEAGNSADEHDSDEDS
ncbi:MAG: tetratricopeptide repeat protein [Chloroflexi bacterium]|nr:tetratricopeptide repeat protein [Chloroflexota bacterium]